MKTFNHVAGLPVIPELPVQEINGKRWYISPSGIKLPSVTTVLGHFKKDIINKWRNRIGPAEANRISSIASNRGKKLHKVFEDYLQNKQLLTEDMMPDIKEMFLKSRGMLNLIDNIHYTECNLYSERLGLAGRTDTIGEYDGTLSIIDFKTSEKAKKEEYIQDYFEQGTAYSLMYEELIGTPIKQVVIFVATDHLPTPQVFVRNTDHYVNSLKEKIRLYNNILQTVTT